MQINVITIFPQVVIPVIEESILKKAQVEGFVKINVYNLRDFTANKYKVVDDYSYGGSGGMVLKPEPIFEAVEYICKKENEKPFIILLSPDGKLFTQEKAKELSRKKQLILICGHYEGVDERVREALVDEEISIGDYVLTGGEIPALVVIDAVVRLIPGVLDEEIVRRNSFFEKLLDYPHYTRPEEFRGMMVPDVLLSGNHEKIRKWRRYESLKRTYLRRREMLETADLTEEDRKMLDEIRKIYG